MRQSENRHILDSVLELLDSPESARVVKWVFDAIPDIKDEVYENRVLPDLQEYIVGKKKTLYDLRVVIHALAYALGIETYLEVGTRRGWTLAQVVRTCPRARLYSFDLWVKDYGGIDNPGVDFVRQNMDKLSEANEWPSTSEIKFFSGNSHDLLPENIEEDFFKGNDWIEPISLVLVDGDHSIKGAFKELQMLFPIVSGCGALVFDDLNCVPSKQGGETKYLEAYSFPECFDEFTSLKDVWEYFKGLYPTWTYIESDKIGIALNLNLTQP